MLRRLAAFLLPCLAIASAHALAQKPPPLASRRSIELLVQSYPRVMIATVTSLDPLTIQPSRILKGPPDDSSIAGLSNPSLSSLLSGNACLFFISSNVICVHVPLDGSASAVTLDDLLTSDPKRILHAAEIAAKYDREHTSDLAPKAWTFDHGGNFTFPVEMPGFPAELNLFEFPDDSRLAAAWARWAASPDPLSRGLLLNRLEMECYVRQADKTWVNRNAIREILQAALADPASYEISGSGKWQYHLYSNRSYALRGLLFFNNFDGSLLPPCQIHGDSLFYHSIQHPALFAALLALLLILPTVCCFFLRDTLRVALLIAIAASICFLWWRSRHTTDELAFLIHHTRNEIALHNGALQYGLISNWITDWPPANIPAIAHIPLSRKTDFWTSPHATELSATSFLGIRHTTGFNPVIPQPDEAAKPPLPARTLRIPLYYPLDITLLLTTVPVRRILRALHRRRHNLCPTCGYDLRATPQKCPECGTPAPSPSS